MVVVQSFDSKLGEKRRREKLQWRSFNAMEEARASGSGELEGGGVVGEEERNERETENEGSVQNFGFNKRY